MNRYYYKTGDQTDYKGNSIARFVRYVTKQEDHREKDRSEISMHIEQYYAHKDPEDDNSEIIYRGIQFETWLNADCVKRLIKCYISDNADKIYILGVFDGKTRFRINTDASVNMTPTGLPRFLYQVMNWESNSSRWNE